MSSAIRKIWCQSHLWNKKLSVWSGNIHFSRIKYHQNRHLIMQMVQQFYLYQWFICRLGAELANTWNNVGHGIWHHMASQSNNKLNIFLERNFFSSYAKLLRIYYMILICPPYEDIRKALISKCYYNRPSMYKSVLLLNDVQKNPRNLTKLPSFYFTKDLRIIKHPCAILMFTTSFNTLLYLGS